MCLDLSLEDRCERGREGGRLGWGLDEIGKRSRGRLLFAFEGGVIAR